MSIKNILIRLPLFALLPAALCANLQPSEHEGVEGHTALHHFSDGKTRGFTPKTLYLVDQKGRNYLFRGNLPEKGDTFVYDEIAQAVRAELAKQGKELSANFQLIDISFLNHVAESKSIKIERDWFRQHPEKGYFSLHSLYGSLVNPLYLNKEIRHFTSHHYNMDGMKTVVQKLHDLLENDGPEDCIIFMHCNAGKDRTGEAAACYLMEYKGYAYKNAFALNQKIASRKQRRMSVNGMRWYAFYLRDVKHVSTVGKID